MVKNIGEKAREIRISKGITQVHVAKALGYKHPSSYNDIEMGRRQLKANKVPQLAKALGVDVETLFFEKEFAKRELNRRFAK